MLAWYLLYSKPQQERVALENLLRQGYETYLPLIRNRKRRQSRYVQVVEAMFPRYLFVHLSDETDNWGPIRSTIGVSGIVRFGARAANVPDDLIRVLRTADDPDGIQTLTQPPLRSGDRVRIVDGPLVGYEAVFEARSGRERVLVLLKIAGHSARLQVGGSQIEPLSVAGARGFR